MNGKVFEVVKLKILILELLKILISLRVIYSAIGSERESVPIKMFFSIMIAFISIAGIGVPLYIIIMFITTGEIN